MSEQKSRKGWIIAVLVAAGLLVAGGGIGVATMPMWAGGNANSNVGAKVGSEAPTPSGTDDGLASPVVEEPEVSATPGKEAAGINPVSAPAVKVKNGTVESVRLMPASGGEPVKGKMTGDGQLWTATERLAFDTEYSFKYTVSDAADRKTSKTRTFTTVLPPNEANAWTYPVDGMTVGVGQPIEINFSEPVLNQDKVEKAISITTSAGQQGAFHWYNDKMLRYRPKNFWQANSTITIDMKLFGVNFGNGMIGNHDSTITVNTTDKKVAVVNNNTKKMKVYINDELVRTMPVTLGMKEWPSTSGYHVVMDQQREARFKAGSIGLKPGDEHYYPPLDVEYASRISQGGEFVHSALEEALPYIGNTNVSHGCIGLFKKDAAWFFNNLTTGDIVHVKHTGNHKLAPLDGYGDWNMSWEKWTQQ